MSGETGRAASAGAGHPAELECDVVVVGGGIVGLATARSIARARPGTVVVVLEKERSVATHQTGRNSGVVHSGIYYRPGSLKAALCREGVGLMREFTREHGVPYVECGKVIVATSEPEVSRLRTLLERGGANGVPGLRWLEGRELAAVEPNVSGLAAVLSPTTAITDYGAVARALANELPMHSGRVLTGAHVTAVSTSGDGVRVSGPGFSVTARYLVNCAGLHSDEVARLAGVAPRVRIVPFRGEYYLLRSEKHGLVEHLVYPVPDPALPFLGVHFTRTVAGGIEAGPNAVLAFSREGYGALTVSTHDLVGVFGYAGFWRLAARFWKVGAYEYFRSFSKAAFTRSLQRLVPSVTSADLLPGPRGVRAQAVDEEGRLVDDFVFEAGPQALHVLNAPSPAATASLAIGRYVAGRVLEGLG